AGDEDAQGEPQAAAAAAAEHGEEMEQAMTKQEALKMLQAVRDRDLMRRMQNLKKVQSRYVPVDKDW
ncbi:hypothetical protein, partial [Symmachiella dynata]